MFLYSPFCLVRQGIHGYVEAVGNDFEGFPVVSAPYSSAMLVQPRIPVHALRRHFFYEPLYPAVIRSAEEYKNSGFSGR